MLGGGNSVGSNPAGTGKGINYIRTEDRTFAFANSGEIGASQTAQTALSGNISGALTGMQTKVMAEKNKIIGTLGAAFVAKALTKGFTSGTLAKLGPIRIKA